MDVITTKFYSTQGHALYHYENFKTCTYMTINISLHNTPLFSSILITDIHLTGFRAVILTTGNVSSIENVIKVNGGLREN